MNPNTQPPEAAVQAGGPVEVGRLVAAAFHDLPQDRWLVPDPADRPEVMAGYFALVVELAQGGAGIVEVSPDGNAVAVWMHVTGAGITPLPDYQLRLGAVTGWYLARFRALETTLEQRHPRILPHEHLAVLAVRAGHQRRGLGSALLAHHHHKLDQAGRPAYVEAATEDLCDFYARHGYEPLGRPIELPDGGPAMFPMWRDPLSG
jgi:GNAT superfamily N-acetyltransferase